MTETVQRRVRLPAELWAALDAIALARGIPTGAIFEEAARVYADPLATINKAARIVGDLASDRAATIEKIELLFLAAAGNFADDVR